ncbi:phospholipase A2 [Streptomyces sp. NPDC055952]|uniref:phospholipase A2 n=1 Tax=Streptomyces sp. NPDC055952 TaxID=3345663 RepID=UPI0035DA9199
MLSRRFATMLTALSLAGFGVSLPLAPAAQAAPSPTTAAASGAPDACGQDPWTAGVPDQPLGFDFTQPCRNHDACRSQADADRNAGRTDLTRHREAAYACHNQFSTELHRVCDTTPNRSVAARSACHATAGLYFSAVWTFNTPVV